MSTEVQIKKKKNCREQALPCNYEVSVLALKKWNDASTKGKLSFYNFFRQSYIICTEASRSANHRSSISSPYRRSRKQVYNLIQGKVQ